MKTLIQIVLVATVVGGLSFAATLFMKPQQLATAAVAPAEGESPPAETPAESKPAADTGTAAEATDHAAEDSDHSPAAADSEQTSSPEGATAEPRHVSAPQPAPARPALPEPPVAVRPPYAPEGDEAGDLINLLRERSQAATLAQQRLAERQDAMQLIFDDLRSEQVRMTGLRKRLAEELRLSQITLEVGRQAIEDERAALKADQAQTQRAADEAVRAANEERDRLRKQLEPASKTPDGAGTAPATSEPSDDNANLKRMATVFDSMSAENSARVFEQLVKNQRTDAVVALLNAMKERQSAKVLGLITETDPVLAADLTDRLKKFKAAPPAR